MIAGKVLMTVWIASVSPYGKAEVITQQSYVSRAECKALEHSVDSRGQVPGVIKVQCGRRGDR